MDKGEESRCELVITRGHPAELLELEEEGLHKMAFLVEPPIDLPRVRVISFWRDTEIRITARDKLPQRLFAISLIRENGCAFQVNSAEQFSAIVTSCTLPAVSMTSIGLPRASTTA